MLRAGRAIIQASGGATTRDTGTAICVVPITAIPSKKDPGKNKARGVSQASSLLSSRPRLRLRCSRTSRSRMNGSEHE